jgi:hypothetical protein
MGARTTWEIKSNDQASIYLYSHWGGDSKLEDTKNAIEQSRPRWSDPTYCARIIVSQLIGGLWNQETGFGIEAGLPSLSPFEEQFAPCVIDTSATFIEIGNWSGSFEEFLSADLDIYRLTAEWEG